MDVMHRAPGNRRNPAARDGLLHRVRAEFHEMPCLRLTREQAQRLFGLRPDVSERVLATLVREGTLTCGPDGRYGMRESDPFSREVAYFG